MKLIQSYVEDKYFVSTVYRQGSDMYQTWYFETMTFEWDKETKEVGNLIAQDASPRPKENGLKAHFNECKRLIESK